MGGASRTACTTRTYVFTQLELSVVDHKQEQPKGKSGEKVGELGLLQDRWEGPGLKKVKLLLVNNDDREKECDLPVTGSGDQCFV